MKDFKWLDPDFLIAGAVVFVGLLIYAFITRYERGGAIGLDSWKCQACFKNIDERATICRYCKTPASFKRKQPMTIKPLPISNSNSSQSPKFLDLTITSPLCLKCMTPLNGASVCQNCGYKLSR